jgi:arginine exporter protein ArgO
MGWLLANLFLIGIVAISAGYFWLFGTGVKLLNPFESAEPYLFSVAAIAALVATYYTAKLLYAWTDRLHKR